MKRLKFDLWFQQYRKIIFLIFISLLTFLIIIKFIKVDININFNEINSTVIGVVGTLLGAVIGGFLSLMGSLWINSKQQSAKQNIKRKNVIYSPLYDELSDIQNRILKLNPYPNHVIFEKEAQTILPRPQFSAWGRIKADTRYLEVPNILVNQMEQLENAIHKYQNIRGKGSEAVQDILNEVLQRNGVRTCPIINIGEVISSDILSNKKVDIYQRTMEIVNKNELDDAIKTKINGQIYEKCNNDEIVLEVREKYDTWIKIQGETIEMLSILIKQVLLKYER